MQIFVFRYALIDIGNALKNHSYLGTGILSIGAFNDAFNVKIANLMGFSNNNTGQCGDKLFYKIEDNTLNIYGEGDMYDYNVNNPEPWRNQREEIESITIEAGATSIGTYAFESCTNLKSFILPDSLKEIKDYAFTDCASLTGINIPATVKTIGKGAFSACTSLKTVTVAKETIDIDEDGMAFLTCELDEINYSGTKQEWEENKMPKRFGDAITDKTKINYNYKASTNKCGDNLEYDIQLGTLFIKGTGKMYDYSKENPAPWNNQKSQIKSILIGKEVTSIGNYAFYDFKNLENLITPTYNDSIQAETLESIGDFAFGNCEKLKRVNVSFKLKTIGKYSFINCKNLEKFTILSDDLNHEDTPVDKPITAFLSRLDSIEEGAFKNCTNLKDINLTNSKYLKTIGENAFESCKSLENIDIPSTVQTIGDSAFLDCQSLIKIEIPDTIESIGKYVFKDCINLTEIKLPDTVKTMEEYAFANCKKLAAVILPDNIKLNKNVFENCTNLVVLALSNKTKDIDETAFSGCEFLNVYYFGSKEDWQANKMPKCLGNAITSSTNIWYNFDYLQLPMMYIQQHLNYYNGDFRHDIRPIRVNGTDSQKENVELGSVVFEALADTPADLYNLTSLVKDYLELIKVSKLPNLNLNQEDFFRDSKTSGYEFILADIITSPSYKQTVVQAYNDSFSNNIITMLSMIKTHMTSAESANELNSLINSLIQVNINENPDKWLEIYAKCINIVNKVYQESKDIAYLAKKFYSIAQDTSVGNVNLSKAALGKAASMVIDSTTSTLTSMIEYYSHYEAYCTASDTYKELLQRISNIANEKAKGAPNTGTGLYNASIVKAIDKFLENATEEATSAEELSDKFINMQIDNFVKADVDVIGKEITDQIGKKCPGTKTFNIVKLSLKIGLLVTDLATEVDDRAYVASMITQLYHLIDDFREAAILYGEELEQANNANKSVTSQLKLAYGFDESIRTWRTCTLMLADLGVELENYHLQSLIKSDEKKAICSYILSGAKKQKIITSNINCHDFYLAFDPINNVVSFNGNLKINVTQCPVTIRVTDDSGKQIALLSDNSQTIEKGYEPYFHVIETKRGSQDDYMKICCVPKSWNVSFIGTGEGEMSVIQADVIDGKVQNIVVSPEITVYKDMEGHISNATNSENLIVVDKNNSPTPEPNPEPNPTPEPTPTPDIKNTTHPKYIYKPDNTPKNDITTTIATGGTVVASPSEAKKGAKVTLTVTPHKGYELDTLVVTDEKGNKVKLTKQSATLYSFTMPEGTVDVDATFKATAEATPVVMPFTDIPEDADYKDAVAYAYQNKMMKGDGNETTFNPNGTMNRATMVTVLYRLEDTPKVATSRFNDVLPNAWYHDAITWAAENNVVSGYSKNIFAPKDLITYEQLASILQRYAQSKGLNKTVSIDAYDPKAPVTRAQFAVIIEKFMK